MLVVPLLTDGIGAESPYEPLNLRFTLNDETLLVVVYLPSVNVAMGISSPGGLETGVPNVTKGLQESHGGLVGGPATERA